MSIKSIDYGLAKSKWNQYVRFSKDPLLQPMVPETRRLTRKNVQRFLQKYSSVYLKPIYGGKGVGVAKLYRIKGTGRWAIRLNGQVYSYRDVASLLSSSPFLKMKKDPYIIQRGISLIEIGGRSLDFRVHCMKLTRSNWTVVGIMGKQAAKNQAVTNFSQGGKAVPLNQALGKGMGMNSTSIQKVRAKLNRLGAYMAKHYFNYARELGLDVGIDKRGKVWIIEGNTVPGANLFRFHEDKTLYGKIMAARRQMKQDSKPRGRKKRR